MDFQIQHDLSINLLNGINGDALGGFAGAAFEIELMGVERADDSAVADQAFSQWALTMRAPALTGKQPSIALPEHGDFLITDQVRSSLPQRDCIDAAKINNGR